MNKRGQFFIIAAVVIIMLLIGLGTIYNSVRTPKENTQVYDLTNQLNFESAQVLDQGVFYALSKSQIINNIENLSQIYANQNPSNDIILVYGNNTALNAITYRNENQGTIGLGTGGQGSTLTEINNRIIERTTPQISGSHIVLTLNNLTYEFDLRSGENLYVVVKGEKNGESTIATNN